MPRPNGDRDLLNLPGPGAPRLTLAETPSLPERVYRGLRDAILNGTFMPGEMLRQEDVAAQLGVSRSPLREALPRLQAEGIVVLHPRRGYAVATLNPKDVAEAFDLRILLETELGRRSIQARTADDVQRVDEIVARMGELTRRAGGADRTAWFNLNADFHAALLAPADCPHHLRALQTTRNVMEAYVRAEVGFTGDLEHAQAEHGELAAAFEAGDVAPFLDLIRHHSIHTRDRLLAGLARQARQET